VGAGGFSSVEQACSASISLTNFTQPIAANRHRYQDYYGIYRSLYVALKPSFDKVTGIVARG